MSERKDPFYNVTNAIAGATQSHAQPLPAPQVSLVSHLNEQSLQAVRQIVREEVQQAFRSYASQNSSVWIEGNEMTAKAMREDPYSVATYRGYSFQELDAVIDFYLMHKGGK